MQPLTLYTVTPSRGTNVRWMLEECGVTYNIVNLDWDGTLKTPDYLAVNPMGKVPALRHGDSVITETAAILTYLAELFPERRLIPPAATPERGQYYRWLLFATHMEYAVLNRWLGMETTEAYRRSCGYGDFDTALNTLTNFLKDRDYAVGKQFSALDIFLSGLIAWGIFRTKTLPAEGVLADYMQRHIKRPAFARVQAQESAPQT